MDIKLKIILIIVILLLIILLGIFVVFPNFTSGINKNNEIQNEKEKNTALNTRLDELLLTRDEYYLLDAEYQKYSLQLPSENDISIFTNEVYDIANYSNIEIYSIDYGESSVSEEDEKLGLSVIRANMVIEGSYYDIINFLSALERIPRIIKIDDLILQTAEDNYESITANIRIRLYYKN
jgi:Tfp pilus assembly protein PilO